MATSRTRRTVARTAVVTLTGAAILTGLGVTAAHAAPSADEQVVTAFHETVKPFDSISIPILNCPDRTYLKDVGYSPGRIVPNGVQVIEPGGVGVTIPHERYEYARDANGNPWYAAIGTNNAGASATNWDPLTARDLTINLVCTSDVSQAVRMAAPR